MSLTAARPAIAVAVEDRGRISYRDGLAAQERLAEALVAGTGTATLLLLEHPPVLTRGRNSGAGHILASSQELERRGVEVHDASRGGDVTYHGPGQLVGYPVLLLPEGRRGVHAYVRDLEEVLIRTLADFGITGVRDPGYPGVWVGNDKVAALGVRIARWVTTHGFALNVDPDLEHFRLITPCGLVGRGVTSMARLRDGRAPAMPEVKQALVGHFLAVFGA